MAEREGFEPSVLGEEYNGFRDRPIRPLWHLSIKLLSVFEGQYDTRLF